MAFSDDYRDATVIGEIWNDTSFDKTKLQQLFDTISGKTNVGFGTLRSMGNAVRTDETAICLKVGTPSSQMITNNGGKEIVVTMGALDWTPTYLSTDKDGNTILTLWMTDSNQLAGKPFSPTDIFDENGTSMWAPGYFNGDQADPTQYSAIMYGTSYIRALVLNNGGGYVATTNDAMKKILTASEQYSSSVFAKFTMDNVPGSLTKYIVTPEKVQWQEYGQNTISQLYTDSSYPNENWSKDIPSKGEFMGQNYNFYFDTSFHDNYAKIENSDRWKNDKLWLPSFTEAGEFFSKIGMWCTSSAQRLTTISTWSRSGYGNRASGMVVFIGTPDEYGSIIHPCEEPIGVRPALHLNLNDVAESVGISTAETWAGHAAETFANENDVNGSTEAQAYEIESAEQLALLAKRVNDKDTRSEWEDKYYKLTDDIFLAQYQWVPIGTFSGHFDGQNHKIYGLNIDTDQDNQGLFGYIGGATIKNVILKDGYIKGGNYCGSLVGAEDAWNAGSQIENCQSNLIVQGTKTVGGLVGALNYNYSPFTMTNCQFYGHVKGESIVGGLVGDSGCIQNDDQYKDLINCVVDAVVEGNESVGAFVGASPESGDPYSFPLPGQRSAAVYVDNCVARGTIIGPGELFLGVDLHEEAIFFTACHFYGSTTQDDLTLDSSRLTSCYAIVNNRVVTSGEVNDSWTDYWAVVPGLNGGLPVQKELFWSAGVADSTAEDIKRALDSFE